MAEFKNSAAEIARHHFRTNHDPGLHDRGYARRHAQSTLACSPTSDLGTLRSTDNQQVNSPGDSNDSRMHHSTYQPSSKHPKRAEGLQPDHAISSGQETFVVASSGTIKKFPGDIFENKYLNTIFDKVSTLIPENDLQKIHFKLETSEGKIVMDSLVERGEVGLFAMMIQRFRRCIEERSKEALRIVLEPHA